MVTSLHYLSTINLFLFKNIQCIGKKQFRSILYDKEICEYADISQSKKLACGQKSTFSMSDVDIINVVLLLPSCLESQCPSI